MERRALSRRFSMGSLPQTPNDYSICLQRNLESCLQCKRQAPLTSGQCSAAMDHVELVATLRSKARKSGQQTSHFRGVSLLKQTNKWHAQINVGGKQVCGSGFLNDLDYNNAALKSSPSVDCPRYLL